MKLRHICLLLLVTLGCWQVARAQDDQVSFEERQTTVGSIRMTVNNLGTIGNSFSGSFEVEGFSSCEYPANSNIEHLFEGALWIGAQVGGETAVSTGSVDDPSGYATGKEGFEFTAAPGTGLEERSSLLDNQFYTPEAVSHQDFVSDFTDANVFVPGTNIPIEGHDNPLGASIHFESYAWNFAFADFFVILNYTITNNSTDIWENAWLGFWLDPVVRNIAVTPPYSGGAAFFDKGGTGYLDSINLGYEFDAAGDVGFTDSYIGLKFLGSEYGNQFYHPTLDTSFKLKFNSWSFRDFDSQYFTPSNDQERYLRLRTGLNDDPDFENVILPSLKGASNRSLMLSAGPYPVVMPGESVNIVFAVVCAQKTQDGQPTDADTPEQKTRLIQNASWAQAAFDGEDRNFNGQLDPDEDRDQDGEITRYILPAPPSIPVTRFEADENKIQLYWADNAEESIDPISQEQDFEGYRVYKTKVGFDLTEAQDIVEELELVAQFDSTENGIGYDNGFAPIRLEEPKFFEGDPTPYRYLYEFDNVLSGWQHGVAVTAFDKGDEELNLQSLESSRLSNLRRVFPGTQGNRGFENGDPFVYPNPYYGGASWEGSTNSEEDRKIMFANLPPRAEVRIYTVAGDLVYSFKHEDDYRGENARWFETYSNTEDVKFAGGEHAWDLLSKDRQIIARGIYVYAVKDLDTGDIRQGKFVVIK